MEKLSDLYTGNIDDYNKRMMEEVIAYDTKNEIKKVVKKVVKKVDISVYNRTQTISAYTKKYLKEAL